MNDLMSVAFVEKSVIKEPPDFISHEKKKYYEKSYKMAGSEFIWLKKLCFFILQKLDCDIKPEPTFRIKQKHLHVPTITRYIIKQRGNLIEHYIRANKQFIVLMGTKQLDLLFSDNEYSEIQKGFLIKAGYRAYKKIYDMNIRIIPWMDGVLVIPLEEIWQK